MGVYILIYKQKEDFTAAQRCWGVFRGGQKLVKGLAHKPCGVAEEAGVV